MLNDIGHYERLNSDDRFKKLKPSLNINTVHSFAGGHPKLESLFNPQSIIVYDANADLYQKESKLFCQKYNYDIDKIEYVKCFVDVDLIKSITYNKQDMVSFVHFLEHLSIENAFDLIAAVPDGIPILIYQPNAERAKTEGWCHFHEQHL